MKGFKSTYIMLFVTVACLGGSYFLIMKKRQADDEEKAGKMLVPIELADVAEWRMTSGKKDIRLVRRKHRFGDWRMLSPVDTYADESAIDTQFKSLASQKIDQVVFDGVGEEPKWEIYGLAEPKGDFRIRANDGKTYEFELGTKKTVDDKYYFRPKGTNKLFVVQAYWAQVLQKTATDFRDKTITLELKHLLEGTNHVTIVNRLDGQKTEIEKIDGQWRLVRWPEFIVDQNKVATFLNFLKRMKFKSVIEENKKGTERLEEFFHNPHDLRFIITKKSKASITEEGTKEDKAATEAASTSESAQIYIQKRSSRLIVVADKAKGIYEMDIANLPGIQLTRDQFRDLNAPFEFDSEIVKGVEIRTSGVSVDLEKSSDGWKLKVEEPDKVLNQKGVEQLFTELNALKVEKFLGLPPKADSKGDRISLRNEAGEEVYSLIWGEKLEKGTLTKIQSKASPELVAVKSSALDNLSIKTLLESKAQPGDKDAKK